MNDRLTPLLRVRDLRVALGAPDRRAFALDKVTVQIRPGATVAVVGETGAGKTLLARAIFGLLPEGAAVDAGSILYADTERRGTIIDIARLKKNDRQLRDLRGGRMALLQSDSAEAFFPHCTIGGVMREGLARHDSIAGRTAVDRAREALMRAGFADPARVLRSRPGDLSAGERQRAALAIALLCRPALLVADEPTAGLDLTEQALILKLVKEAQAETGMAVLLLTDDLGLVPGIADEVVLLHDGRTVDGGPPEEFLSTPRHAHAKALLAAAPRFDLGPGERLRPIDGAAGDPARCPPIPGRRGEPALSVSGLSLDAPRLPSGPGAGYRPCHPVSDVGFEIRRGECLAVVGERGSGTTAVAAALLGEVVGARGEAVLHGPSGPSDLLAAGGEGPTLVGHVGGDPRAGFDRRRTVESSLAEPLVLSGTAGGDELAARIAGLLALAGISPERGRHYPHAFSAGELQRLAVARAVAAAPALLICEHPVAALPPSERAAVLNLIKDITGGTAIACLLISNDLAAVHYLADRLAVMCAGWLVEAAPREEFFRNPVHPHSQALLASAPDPNPRNPLDLTALAGAAADPAAWPAPFTIDADRRPGLFDLGEGHLVRAAETALKLKLAS